jgi:beta-lactamase class D
MKIIIKIFLITAVLMLNLKSLYAQEVKETGSWGIFFVKNKVQGTFVLQNLKTGKTQVYNLKRAQTRLCPASTFKIPNSLIALQCGSVKSVNDTIRWDARDKGRPEWNKDQDMQSAIKVSCVWFYQELARRTGETKMQEWLHKIKYGNEFIGQQVDYFWLNGDLKISAVEQIGFLKNLINENLPFDKEIQKSVKKILLTEATSEYKIYSKTGWSTRTKPGIGWLVGWVESGDSTYIFAMNIDINNDKETLLRKQISYEILEHEGIIRALKK